jgi:hypothetical protein
VIHDEETGTESAVISLGAGVRKRVTLNTHAGISYSMIIHGLIVLVIYCWAVLLYLYLNLFV